MLAPILIVYLSIKQSTENEYAPKTKIAIVDQALLRKLLTSTLNTTDT